MKQTCKTVLSILFITLFMFCTVSCENQDDTLALWANAIYLSDTAVGEGANTVFVEITAGEKTITLTVNTDKVTLGEALYEHTLINDPTFFDTCNGIKADWDKDQAYWAFYIGDEMALFGVDDAQAVTTGTPIYRIVYTK